MRTHPGQPIPSPALLRPIHDRFIAEVEDLVRRHRIPVIHFERGQKKDDIANCYRARVKAREGVVLLGWLRSGRGLSRPASAAGTM